MRDLPRLGSGWEMTSGFQKTSYFARGPWENYCDRKASALAGIYEAADRAREDGASEPEALDEDEGSGFLTG